MGEAASSDESRAVATPPARSEPGSRDQRLRAIADRYTLEITAAVRSQIAGADPVSRYAAVTSEGRPEADAAADGNLLVADSVEALSEKLGQECEEGWLAHGRLWDLDGPWHPAGNLEASYAVIIGDGYRPPPHVVEVEGHESATFRFDDPLAAEAFKEMVCLRGGSAKLARL